MHVCEREFVIITNRFNTKYPVLGRDSPCDSSASRVVGRVIARGETWESDQPDTSAFTRREEKGNSVCRKIDWMFLRAFADFAARDGHSRFRAPLCVMPLAYLIVELASPSPPPRERNHRAACGSRGDEGGLSRITHPDRQHSPAFYTSE